MEAIWMGVMEGMKGSGRLVIAPEQLSGIVNG